MIAWLLPAAVGVVAVAALPAAIHLLTRSPAQRRAFPALRLLAAAHGGTARLSRLRELLALLLRTLALAAAALALAGPLWRAAVTGAGAPVVVVVDASLSMRQTDRGTDVWTQAVAEARRIIAAAAPRPVLAITAGNLAVPSAPLPGTDPGPALALLDTSAPGHGGADLAGALALARNALKDGGDLWLVGDGSRSAWSGVDPGSLPDGVRFHGVIAGGGGANLALKAIAIIPGEAIAGRPLRIQAEVANYGPENRTASVRLAAGEAHRIASLQIPAGGTGLVTLDLVPAAPGALPLLAEIEGAADALPDDDRRVGLATVTPALPVVVASDGDAADPRGPLKPLLAALAAAGAAPRRIDGAALNRLLAEPDGSRTVLVTVALARRPDAGGLVRHLLGGGAWLAVVAGDGDAALLAAIPDLPSPILPGAQVDLGARSRGIGVGEMAGDHPLLSGLRGREPLLAQVEAWRYRPGRLGEGAVRLASWADGAPLLAERRVGDGRWLVLNASPAESEGNLSAVDALPLLLEPVTRVLQPPRRADCALPVNAQVASDPPVLDGEGRRQPVLDGRTRLERPGRYHQGPQQLAVAVPALECDLRRVPAPVGADLAGSGAGAAEDQSAAARGRPLWPWLLLGALVLLAAESLVVRRP